MKRSSPLRKLEMAMLMHASLTASTLFVLMPRATGVAIAAHYAILAAVLRVVGRSSWQTGEALARAVSEAGGAKGVSYPASAPEVVDTRRKIGEAGARSHGRAEVAHDAGAGVGVLFRRS